MQSTSRRISPTAELLHICFELFSQQKRVTVLDGLFFQLKLYEFSGLPMIAIYRFNLSFCVYDIARLCDSYCYLSTTDRPL